MNPRLRRLDNFAQINSAVAEEAAAAAEGAAEAEAAVMAFNIYYYY